MKINNLTKLVAFVVFILLLSCEKNMEGSNETADIKYFHEKITVEKSVAEYVYGDTIWFSANFSDKLTDSKSQAVISLENQTFMLHGTINLLKPKYDSIPFIDENFDLVEDLGSIQLINVFNTAPAAYTFDIRFGRPLLTNEVRFGLVLKYLGIYAVEYSGWVFYGSERVDFDDFSIDNGKGYLNISFTNEAIHDSIFYSLPDNYLNYFQNYYNSGDIYSNKFNFFKVN